MVLQAAWLYGLPQAAQVVLTRLTVSRASSPVRAVAMVATWIACATVQQLLAGPVELSASALLGTAVYWSGLTIVLPLAVVRLLAVALLGHRCTRRARSLRCE